MRIGNATDQYKVTRSYTARKSKGPSFGPQGPRVPDIESIATRHYDPKLAYVMAVISTWAYADERTLAEKLRYYGIEGARVRRITVQNNALLVVATAYLIQSHNGRAGVLAFRGTDPASFISILADGETMQRPFAGGVVHSGFYTNVEAVWDDVAECLDGALNATHIEDDAGKRTKLDSPLESLYVTGHSLGGAMALLAAARIFQGGFDAAKRTVKGVYTFGQPMVGDKAFAEGCKNDFGPILFRHVYRRDIVPHLPPKSELGYQHTGAERQAAALNTAWKDGCPPSDRISFSSALIEVAINAVETRLTPSKALHGLSIDDHMPSNYVDVSRYTIDPNTGCVVAGRNCAPPWFPQDIGGALRNCLGSGGGSNSSRTA